MNALDEGAPSSSIWGHQASEAAVYLLPYVDLEPDSLFVAAADGQLVGYLTGCINSSTFPTEAKRISQAIRQHRLVLKPGPLRFLARAGLDTIGATIRREPTAAELEDGRWPAHLHINVVREVRGTGVAAGLMERWLDRLHQVGAPGCYLQTLVENPRAVRFFERMGFERTDPRRSSPASATPAGDSTNRRWCGLPHRRDRRSIGGIGRQASALLLACSTCATPTHLVCSSARESLLVAGPFANR